MALSETSSDSGQTHGIQGRPVRPSDFRKTTRNLMRFRLPEGKGQGPMPGPSPTPGAQAPQSQFPAADRPKPPPHG